MDKPCYYGLFSHRWVDSDGDEWNFVYGTEEKSLENNFDEDANFEIDTSNYPSITVTSYEPQTAEGTEEEALSEEVMELHPLDDPTFEEWLMWRLDYAMDALFTQLTNVPKPVQIPWWIYNVSQAAGQAMNAATALTHAAEIGLIDLSLIKPAISVPMNVWVTQFDTAWQNMIRTLEEQENQTVPGWWTTQCRGYLLHAMTEVQKVLSRE